MTDAVTVVIEREFACPPEKLWRALTTPHLLAEWLMQNDFKPEVDHRFKFTADWGSVDCQVLVIDPLKELSCSWAAMGVDTITTFYLTPTASGTRLRVEQAGFRQDQNYASEGAKLGWQNFLQRLDAVVSKLN
jgi:uncharacterized protein YndB with AHSA1/START domain